MTYEEKDNQAIDVIKKIKEANKDNAALVDFIEYNYPELKEDDDGKIRKELIEFLDNIWHLGKDANFDKYGKADCANWISWLEKQKCYKPTDAQIEALRAAAYEAYKPNYITLQTLYEDLKKL